MPAIITPTVGRKVWYRPSHHDKNFGTEATPPMTVNSDEPLDATVIAVWGDRLVNLVIFDIYGHKYERRSVALKQEGDTVPEGSAYAEWMPYQQTQAKKQDAEAEAEDKEDMHEQEKTKELNFGDAIAALKSGRRVARVGWNGKGMWLSLVNNWNGNVIPDAEQFQLLPFIAMRTAQADIVPWLASQTDMLAEDWEICDAA